MGITLSITPGGHLEVVEAADSLPLMSEETELALRKAFATSSAEGLLLLASQQLEAELPATFVFWRGVARRFFQAICHLGENEFAKWKSVPPPDDEQLAQLVADSPPMRGLEYLSSEVFQSLWSELRELVAERGAKHPEGPAAYLRSVNPLWHLLGRVTFHLAENKRDPHRPFAFMATYTHKMSGHSRLQHLPLAEALKTYAGSQERAKLESLLEPVRRAAEQSKLARDLLDSKQLFSPQAWNVNQAYRFLTEAPVIEQAGVVVRLPNWWSARRPPRPQVQVSLGAKPASQLGMDSLLDFQIDLALDGEPLSEAERKELLAGTDGLVLLRGKWVEASREKLQEAIDHWQRLQQENPDGVSLIAGMRMLAGAKLDGDDVLDDEVSAWSRVTAGDWLRQTLEQMRQPASMDACHPGRDLLATLRPYQIDGVRWLWFMTKLGLGGCLADDMGLGKTIQVLDLLLQRKQWTAEGLKQEQVDGPSLLIVPSSLIGNWKSEVARFAPSLKLFVAHLSECDAGTLDRVAKSPARELADFDLVITTYGLARRQEWLAKVTWSLIVLDEAQAIKNASSTQTRSVKKLSSFARLVLTGTPVENHLGDLWSLFDFCCPGLLGNANQFKQFVKRLNKQQDTQAFGALRRLVRPYILRRMKTDPSIVPDLPEKTEMRVECGLSKKQALLYEKAVKDLAKQLENAEGIARKGLVLTTLMQLKQICNHPAQFLHGTPFLPDDSGKFERLRLLCEPIVERQEKVLVFTQFQSLTEPLAAFLATVFGRDGLVLHGGTPVKKRSELVRIFQTEQGPPFFVISLKAGGSGLNLTAASHVIHFDRWWNPAVENQATDRAFRIGQKRNVLVHKYVCRGTVEERIDAMIADKQSVADQLLNQESEPLLTEMKDDELLRFVALDISRATAEE